MIKLIDKYPNDLSTLIKLSSELEYIMYHRPDLVFTARFVFLLDYFEINGDNELKAWCTESKRMLNGIS